MHMITPPPPPHLSVLNYLQMSFKNQFIGVFFFTISAESCKVECQIVSADVLHLLRRSVIQLVEIVKKSL